MRGICDGGVFGLQCAVENTAPTRFCENLVNFFLGKSKFNNYAWARVTIFDHADWLVVFMRLQELC